MRHKLVTYLVLAAVLAGCNIDLADVNTAEQSSAGSSEIQLQVRVSGEMISTRTDASDDEMRLTDVDILVFRLASTGDVLEYAEFGREVTAGSLVEGSIDRTVLETCIILPSTGTKKVVVIGNGSRATYPDMLLGTTTYDDFCAGFHIDAASSRPVSVPMVMTGETLVANSANAAVFVRLARQCNRFDILNRTPGTAASGLFIKYAQIVSAPAAAYPFVSDFDEASPDFISFPGVSVANPSSEEIAVSKFYLLYTPGGSKAGKPVEILLKGSIDGTDYTETFTCDSPLYADYHTTMALSLKDGKVNVEYTPDYDSFQSEGGASQKVLASWNWTGLKSGNEYADQWLGSKPVGSPEGGLFTFVQDEANRAGFSLTYSVGTPTQLKNRMRIANPYVGDYFLWTVPVSDVKRGGTLSFRNGFVSATQWGPKYYSLQYSFDGTNWTAAQKEHTEKAASTGDRDVTYTARLAQQDSPETLDFDIEVKEPVKQGFFYIRLLVVDKCRAKEANGDIESGDGKSAGITYVHVDNSRISDKDATYQDDWASIKVLYTDPE